MGASRTATATPRASANITVGFGLVNVKFAIAPLADTQKPVSGKYVCPEHGPTVNQRYMCSAGTKDEHLLEAGGQLTAYPHPETGEYYVLGEGVLKEIAEDKDGRAEVERIVDASSIDPIWFEKSYMCWPQAGSEREFDLLTDVLRAQGKAAQATVVLTKETRTLVIRWSEELGTLVAHTCRFQSDIRWANANLVKSGAEGRPEPNEAYLKQAEMLMAELEDEFDPGEVVDLYTPRLQDAIRAAADGKPLPKKAEEKAEPKEDLLDALTASVKAVKAVSAAKKPAAKKPAARKPKAAA